MPKLKIVMVASEAAPFARTGGLGDVLGSLPKALAKLGHEVKVFLPRYRTIGGPIEPVPLGWTMPVSVAGKSVPMSLELLKGMRSKVEHYFVRNDFFFDRPEFYRDPETGKDYEDNDERFTFFSRAVLESIRKLGWQPDIIHVNDWQAALIPVYMKTLYADVPAISNARSVLTIHNLGYQGLFSGKRFEKLQLPRDLFYAMTGAFEFYGKVNFLKAGITYADKITTVSRRYAEEIQSGDEFGCGLEGVLEQRTKDLSGIVNGVDYTVWSPTRDKKIPYRYTINNLSGKRKNKVELLGFAHLPVRDRWPLIGMVTRLTAQKGLDLIEEAADELFKLNLQMIVLGTGDEKYHELLTEFEQKYPDRIKAFLKFDDTLAHRIEAAADMFLMPSRWEPCGLNQLYSLRYGTVPIVRAVGGLADTVIDFDESTGKGTGFSFDEYESDAMLKAITRSLAQFKSKRAWARIVKAGMNQDFSWDNSAAEYSSLFERLVAR
ncbi:MAG TPA: glycogen synthase GlgA [Candidatus Acidoferrum sp.]|nr:glycogen synthase GlgA [Candidatus Acidoferrum sp.]